MSSPPTTLGPYQIIREIARSNDIVYEAYDPTMNRRVAIKELAMPNGATPQQREDRLQRFKREAQAAGTLAHPNIMTVYSFAEDAGRQYIAMEYLDGNTLRNEIDTKGFLPPDRAVEIALAVLNGLSHAHEKGVVHRDIKPDNIQVLSNGQIKITDFGIARLTFQPNLTMDGQVFGTPSYMSPEQVVGREIDARSDLFSVGVMLYEMVSGTKPFAGDSVVSITYAIMNAEPTAPAQANHSLWGVIRQALDKSPALRFSSASEMSQALQYAITSSQQQVLQPNPPPIAYSPTFQPGAYPQQTPYTQAPYSQAVVPPPVVYPYNPYQDPQAAAQAQMQAQMQAQVQAQAIMGAYQGQPGTPVYYPPPPRKPLLTPEMRLFLSRLIVALIVLGTLIGLLITLGTKIIEVSNQNKLSAMDRPKLDEIYRLDPNRAVTDRIRQVENIRNSMVSPIDRQKADTELAKLYQEQGVQSQGKGDPVAAEASLQASTELDGKNVDSYVGLAKLLANNALTKGSDAERALAWKESANAWTKASQITRDNGQKVEYHAQAAEALVQYADLGYRSGTLERADARRALYDARGYVASGSPLLPSIESLLSRLR
ncbi:MAG: serine/threonine-protein kinase [Fimbriimonas sp.]